jgi:hypothetical protein
MVEKILTALITSGLAENQYRFNLAIPASFSQLIERREPGRRGFYRITPRDYAEELAAGLEYIYGAGVAIIPPSAAVILETEE